MKKVALLALCCITTACTSLQVYVHPSIKGQFINRVTNEPLSNKSYIASTIKEREFGKNYTNSNGNFHVKAEKVNYRSESLYNANPREVFFLLEGYELKKVNYLEFPYTPENPSRYEESEVNIGKVYLEPKKQP